MKTDVYSWRLTPDMKDALEEEARRAGQSLAELLERMAREWLEARRSRDAEDEAGQERLRSAASRTFGTLHGGNRRRSTEARSLVRERLAKSRAAQRSR